MNDAAPELSRLHDQVQLELLAAKALSAGDFATSFKFADRRCRIDPPAAAHCFVLRAEACWRLGQREAAVADLGKALEIAPHDVGANRRMLAWAAGRRRRQAANELLANDSSSANLRAALAVLREAGEQNWVSVSTVDTEVFGWIAWTGGAEIEARLSSADNDLSSLPEADPFHPLTTSAVNAAMFRLRRPLSRSPQTLTFRRDGTTFRSFRLPPNMGTADNRQSARPVTSRPGQPAPVTVIVPVYGDVTATIGCLDSLRAAANTSNREQIESGQETSEGGSFRILVIDDATPETELAQHLRSLATALEIELLVNAVNLGFIGAVNRALATVTDGDVILLNSDTIVPPGFVDRLTTAAHSAADIGTVTPLSNNGEFFSFPDPNTVNALPGGGDSVDAYDSAAADVNEFALIEMPSGIGFCLYIKRACLDLIGGLSEQFNRGYLEDVDFCLRARAAGFRNVCAPSVYVGHHGSRSFQQSKRALVLRNLDVLERRFPGYRNECRAIEAADPLGPARSALEAALPDAQRADVLIVAGRGALRTISEARAQHLAENGERAILLLQQHHRFRLIAVDGGIPQSTWLRLDSPDAAFQIDAVLTRTQVSRLELIDPSAPAILIDIAHQRGMRVDRWIAAGDMLLCAASDNEQLLAPTEGAVAFAHTRPGRGETQVQIRSWTESPLLLPPVSDGLKALIVVPSSASAQSWQAMRVLARYMHQQCSSIPLVVAGETFNDGRLMSYPNAFVTGPVKATELADVIAPHNPGWILTDFETPLFGHPLIEAARQAPRPVAYRDWSNGAIEPRMGDLAIAGEVDDEAMAVAIARWIAGE